MPNLFSRRRGSSVPPVDRDTQAAAAAAAGSAFLNASTSQAALSSAAAAAALRSHTTSPEPVASIQTKRMVRRGSNSSVNSSVYAGSVRGGPSGRAATQRRASNASMTERTFRSPSPKGSVRLNGTTSPAPPVPALPRGAERSSSVEPVQRVMSPTPPRGRGGRGSSLDRSSLPPPPSQRWSKRMSNLTEGGEEEGERAAPNFSRPSPQTSPVTNGAKKYTHGTGGFFAGPTGTKDARNARPQTSDGIRAGPEESDDPVMVYDPNSRTFVPRPRNQPQADSEPPSPVVAAPIYDPNSRSFITPRPEPIRTTSSDSTTGKKKKPVLSPVETQLQPPPRNPARLSPTSSASPTSPRYTGQLHKQPSVVREDPEAEEREASPASPTGRPAPSKTITTSAGPAKVYIAPTARSHQRSSSLDIPRGVSSRRGRNVSASPSRSAHFAAAPIIAGTKHEPLARAASPVKSAMKHSGQSPASSVRTSSPMATFSPAGPKAPPSETSDLTSEASDEGHLRKEKKRARVSFDEQPKAIDASGAVAAPKAITAIGGSAAAAAAAADSDEDLDAELSKPRPALPSFGSVRRNRASSPPEKVTEMAPERDGVGNDAASGGILANAKKNEPLAPEVTSKDAAAISDESEDDSSFHPDATSTPGGGKPVQARKVSVDELDPKTRDFAAHVAEKLGSEGEVPAIQLLPPTPGDEAKKELSHGEEPEARESFESAVEKAGRNSLEKYDVPGGWATEESSGSGSKDTANTMALSRGVVQPPALAVADVPAADSTPSPILAPLTEESEEGEFSDAAEDLSDLEDGGFASLDAIVTSPVAPATASPAGAEATKVAVPESPTTTPTAASKSVGRDREMGNESTQTSGDWSEATAYWSRLSRQQKEQIEREHLSDDDTPKPKPVPKKSALKKTKKVEDEDATPRQREREPHTMPKTMRAQAGPTPAPTKAEAGRGAGADDGKVHMRRSMRGAAGSTTSMPASMRERPQSSYTAPRQTEQAPTRPRSAAGPRPRTNSDDSATTPMAQTSVFPRLASAVPPPGTYTKKIQNRVSAAAATNVGDGDSDSESSFRKRQRRRAGSQSTVDSSGRYAMRRSMRGASISTEATSEMQRPSSPTPVGGGAGGKKAFSIRSLSPSGGSVFGKSKGEKLRSSLRSGSVDAAASGGRMTTLRSGPAAPAPTMRAGKPPGSAGGRGFRSRFANDSDDEDEPRGRSSRPFFKSRFADSDDEDEADGAASPPLRPVRGIPRKAGRDDGDSTDLEDEEDVDPRGQDPWRDSRQRDKVAKPGVPAAADVDKAMDAARKKLGIPAAGLTGTEGTALSKGSLRQPEEVPTAPIAAPSVGTGTPEKKKRGFMGSILRRNRGSQASVMTVSQLPAPGQAGSPATTATPSSPPPQVNGNIPAPPSATTATATGSPGAKLLRRSSAQQPPPKMVRGNSNFSTMSTATAPVALSSLRRKDSDIPPVPALPRTSSSGPVRPATSDGPSAEAVRLARTLRPDLIGPPKEDEAEARGGSVGRSVGFAPGSKEEDGGSELGGRRGGGEVYSRRTGRKKRFAGLRKMFGLYD